MHVFFDSETHCFRPGLMAPPIVCVQFCVDGGAAHLMTKRGEVVDEAGNFSSTPWGVRSFSELLAHWITQGATLVGHNVCYDLGCFAAWDQALVPLIFRAYKESRVSDTMLRQQLVDIGRGKYRGFQAGGGWVQLNYNLGDVGGRHGFRVNKDDPFRMHYDLLDDVPLAQWPDFYARVPDVRKGAQPGAEVLLCGQDAIKYGLGDVHATRAAYCGQSSRYSPDLLVDEYAQARRFWALHLSSVWGLRTSLRGVLSLEKGARERYDHLGAILLEAGLVRRKSKRDATLVRDTKAAKERIEKAYAEIGMPVRKTKGSDKNPPQICLDSEACASSGDPLLESYSEFSSMSKVLSNDVEMLRTGTVTPIHTRWGMAETGRTTSSKPNCQNPRRLPGVREAFVPRGFIG